MIFRLLLVWIRHRPILDTACFCIARKLRVVFTFLKHCVKHTSKNEYVRETIYAPQILKKSVGLPRLCPDPSCIHLATVENMGRNFHINGILTYMLFYICLFHKVFLLTFYINKYLCAFPIKCCTVFLL